MHLYMLRTTSETKDNLAALGIAYQPTRRFETVLDVSSPRRCSGPTVCRPPPRRDCPRCRPQCRSGISGFDIDLLVSDYFKAKTALDGESADAMHERYDNGGRGVHNFVSIGGYRVPLISNGWRRTSTLDGKEKSSRNVFLLPPRRRRLIFRAKNRPPPSLPYPRPEEQQSLSKVLVAFLKSTMASILGVLMKLKALNDFMLQRGYRIVHSTAFHSYRDPRRSS